MQQTATLSRDLLSIADIEAKTGISQRTLWRWVSAGQFPKPDLSVGRIRRWRAQTVQSWIESQAEIA